MKFAFHCLLSISFTLMLFWPAGAAEEKETWAAVYLNGKKISWQHIRTMPSYYKGAPARYTVTTSKTLLKTANREEMESLEIRENLEDMNARPLYERQITTSANQRILSEMKKADGFFVIRRTLNNSTETVEIPWSSDIFTSFSGRKLKELGLKTGSVYTIRALYTITGNVETETAEIGEKETLETIAGPKECFKVKISTSLLKDIPQYSWVDDKGGIWKSRTLGLEVRVVAKEEALSEENLWTGGGTLRTGQKINPLLPFEEMAVAIKVPQKDIGGLFPENAYQKAENRGDTVRLILRKESDGRQPEIFREEWRKPELYIDSDNEKIAELALDLTEYADGDREKVKNLTQWVFLNIEKQYSDTGILSAGETLQQKAGDCTEHTALLCALARSAGMAARPITGLVFSGEGFDFHAWAELEANGRWTGADAVTNTVGLPASYIYLGEGMGNEAAIQAGMKIMELAEQAEIRIESLRLGNREYRPGQPELYVVKSGNSAEQRLWDLRFDIPENMEMFPDQSRHIRFSGKHGEIFLTPLYSMFGSPEQEIEKETALLSKRRDIVWGELKKGGSSMLRRTGLSENLLYHAEIVLKNGQIVLIILVTQQQNLKEGLKEFEALKNSLSGIQESHL